MMICSACDVDLCELCGHHCHCSHHHDHLRPGALRPDVHLEAA